MPEAGLAALYQLHLIDAGLQDLKNKAAGLDIGKDEITEAKRLVIERDKAQLELDSLKGQHEQLSDKARQLRQQADKHERQLFGGEIDVHHAEAAQKDIDTARWTAAEYEQQAAVLNGPIDELRSRVSGLDDQIHELQRSVKRKRKTATDAHAEIEQKFKQLAGERPARAKGVPSALLAQYEAIRKRTGSTGMAVITPTRNCAACGVAVPEKEREFVARDQVVTCQSCKRIYFSPLPSA
jgi:predicted  nucleic acid-binding Zn-ribbon protein